MSIGSEPKSKHLSIVIGTYNRLRYLKIALDSIRDELARCAFSSDIIVVDGGSTDGSTQWLAGQKDVITIIQHNHGVWKGKDVERRSWGYFMNLGFRCAQGKYICMLSDDCLVVPGAIRNGYQLFEEQVSKGRKVGAVAFYWRNWPEQKKYWVGLTFGDKMFVNHGLYLKKALEDVDYVDEQRYSFYHADGDLCLRMWQKGYECIDSPDSYIEHYSHANKKVRTINSLTQSKDWEAYCSTWKALYGDPSKDWIERSFVDEAKTAGRFKRKWGIL